MALLLYCICEAQAEVAPPSIGVREAAVQDIVADGLRCFYSEIGDLGASAAAVQKDALDFHRVTHYVLQSTAVIPFQFPALVKDTAEAAAFLTSHAKEYAEALKCRLRETVQMEVRICETPQLVSPNAGETRVGQLAEAASGAQYLRARAEVNRKLEQATALCKAAAQSYAVEWRQRRSGQGVHCYALVRRSEVYNFEQALRALPVDPALKVIVSGPWPATEFLEL